MGEKTLRIGKPYVIVRNSKSVLVANIDDAGEVKTLEFAVENKFKKFLTYERSDAFVVALLYYAMIKGRDIEWEVPCTERLIYQLQTFFIPVYEREIAFMHGIKLCGPTTVEILLSENGVATGITNGVDSCYSIYKYLETPYSEQKLSHVVFTDWYLDFWSEEYKATYLEKYLDILPDCAKELGLEFIYVSLNVDKHFSIGHFNDKQNGLIQDVGLGALKFCAIPLALQKLIKVFYFSSGYSTADFSMKISDTAYHDLFTLPQLSTEAVRFYSSGVETHRVDKTATIADWAYAQEHLEVCALGAGGIIVADAVNAFAL